MEAFVLDFAEDLYGQRVRFEFAQRLRDTFAFAGVTELIGQMHADVAQARRLMGSR